MDAPEPIDAPDPQPPSYQLHAAPVPSEPPFTVSVILLPRQSCPFNALLVALEGAEEGDCTITCCVHVAALFAQSVTVHVTTVVPNGNEAGASLVTEATEQLSEVTGVPSAGVFEHETTSAGQEISGAVSSRLVIITLDVEKHPLASVYVTVKASA